MSSRVKKTEKLDTIGNLALSPEKVPDLLTESIHQNELYIKAPNWDSPGNGIELLALQNEREYNQMLQLQDEMLHNVKRQQVINSNRIDELYEMLSHNRSRFIEANNFFKDCYDKKRSAESKVSAEKQVHAELKLAISTYKTEIDTLTEFREVLKKTVQEFEPYESVLQDAVSESDVWTSVKDCMDQCDALMMKHAEIDAMSEEKLREIKELRSQMITLTNEAASTVLRLNNELSELERAYAEASSECLKWEKILSNTKDCITQNVITKIKTLDEISNMYLLLCKRKGIDTDPKSVDVEKQMDFIKDEFKIIQGVVNECLKN